MRVAAALLGCYGGLLTLEAIWVGIMPRWFDGAREWAGPRPLQHTIQLVVGAAVAVLLSRSVIRGRRWAWQVARIWAGILGGFGIVALTVIGFTELTGTQGLMARHRLEIAAGTLSVVCLLASVVLLARQDSRDFFSSRQPARDRRTTPWERTTSGRGTP